MLISVEMTPELSKLFEPRATKEQLVACQTMGLHHVYTRDGYAATTREQLDQAPLAGENDGHYYGLCGAFGSIVLAGYICAHL